MQEKRIKRLLIYGIIGIIDSFYLTIDYFMNKTSVAIIVLACSLFLFSIFFIIAHIKLKRIAEKKSSKK